MKKNKRPSLRAGLGFGFTSGPITVLGLMVGLHSILPSKLILIGGILTIAIADAMSDSLGMHVAKEATNLYSTKEVWEVTIYTFLSKFFIAISFIFPFYFFQLPTAMVTNIIWGLLLLGTFSFFIARKNGNNPWKVVIEHLAIATVVIITSHYFQILVKHLFGEPPTRI